MAHRCDVDQATLIRGEIEGDCTPPYEPSEGRVEIEALTTSGPDRAIVSKIVEKRRNLTDRF